MSKENVELHRRGIEAFNAHDVEAFIALCDPSVEANSVFAEVGDGVYRGHESSAQSGRIAPGRSRWRHQR